MLSACLTCQHARKPRSSGMGQAVCVLSDAAHEVMHVCRDFQRLGSFHNAERAEGFPSCSVSTTATNSPSGDFSSKNHSLFTGCGGVI